MTAPRDHGPTDPGVSEQTAALANVVDLAANVVEAMTAVKAQYVAAGWTPVNAEQAVLLLWRQSMDVAVNGPR